MGRQGTALSCASFQPANFQFIGPQEATTGGTPAPPNCFTIEATLNSSIGTWNICKNSASILPMRG
jgi:hypothetical protein